MKTYVYKLKDESGKSLYGFVDAKNKQDLKGKLKHSKFFFASAKKANRDEIFRQKTTLEGLLMFTRRLTALIESGIPILTAMHILWRQTEDRSMQLVISHIRQSLEGGKGIAEALDDFPRMFPIMYRAMVRVAEKAGGLVAILRKLTSYLEYQRYIKTRTEKATLYPMIVIGFTVVVVFVLFAFVVPTFEKVLLQMNVPLPWYTNFILSISNTIFSPYFILLSLITVVLLVFIYKLLRHRPKVSYAVDEWKMKIPVWGKIIYFLCLSRFVHSLNLLIGAGLPIVESFEVSKSTTGNQRIVTSIDQVQKKVEQGASLYDSFQNISMFPVMLIEMIGVGESSGQIVKILDHLAAHFDEEVEYRQNKFFTVIEPALIAVVGIIVLLTLIAIYLPIISIWDALAF